MSSMLKCLTVAFCVAFVNSALVVNRYTCNNPSCGVIFNNIDGDLSDVLESFDIEFLVEGATVDGGAFIKDSTYPNGGFYIFTVFGFPGDDTFPGVNLEDAGLWRIWFDENDNISLEQVVNLPFTIDLAYDRKNAPDVVYVTGQLSSSVYVINVHTGEIVETISGIDGELFNTPNGIYADGKGNIYFTDPEVVDPAFPAPRLEAGRVYRIDILNNNAVEEVVIGEFGYIGIDGRGRYIALGNSMDFPPGEYRIFDFSQTNRELIDIELYKRNRDGSLTFRKTLFSINDYPERFGDKSFLDGIGYDPNGNLWACYILNLLQSKIIIISPDGELIGEIEFSPPAFQVVSIDYNPNDGYMYVGTSTFTQGFVGGNLFRVKVPDQISRRGSSSDSSDTD